MTDYVAGGVPERAVPRTTEARNADEAAALAARRSGPTVAFWGIAMLVASEATLFGTFIGSYYYLRFTTSHWPPQGTPEPRVVVPLILVGVLATTSLPMQLAARAVRRGRLWATWALLVWALVVQCGYLAYELHELAGVGEAAVDGHERLLSARRVAAQREHIVDALGEDRLEGALQLVASRPHLDERAFNGRDPMSKRDDGSRLA